MKPPSITAALPSGQLAAYFLGEAIAEMRRSRTDARIDRIMGRSPAFNLRMALAKAKHARFMRDRIAERRDVPAEPMARKAYLDRAMGETA
jgi:hypothetical protein